jgi:glutamine amidotransferase
MTIPASSSAGAPVVVVDYDMGNPGSVLNMLAKIGQKGLLSRQADDLDRARKIILPGVGSFDEGMRNLERFGLLEILRRRVIDDRVPFLGICLGMQLLTESSEEGLRNGLGWIRGRCRRFPANARIKVPHMGWNSVRPTAGGSTLFSNLPEESRFYFVHSYYVEVDDPADVAGVTHHGIDLVSAVVHEHIFGTQFHPEKSHRFGMQLMKNFAER